MAIDIKDTPIDSRISLNRSIPGQSLTNDPDDPYPWEKPPEFTDLSEAGVYLVNLLSKEENYGPIMDTIADGTPLMDLTQGILFKGFTEGKWNPDLMMILAEPLCYILLALCERANIEPIIYDEEDDDAEEDNQLFNVDVNREKIKSLSKSPIPAGALPEEVMAQIENTELPSLLEQPKQIVEEDNSSLLGRN